MSKEKLLEKIENLLSDLLINIDYKNYISIIKNNKYLEKYDYILGEYMEYNEVPEEYQYLFSDENLNQIIDYLEIKKKEFKLN